ncbi:MAG: porin family protein [Rhodospirillales bacterium]|nr:porin family protein [Rhodospirillales bacterium]
MTKTGPLATLALGTACLCTSGATNAADRIRDDFTFTYHIEVAGADTSDVATDKELRDSGTKMIPAKPSAKSRDPLKQEAPKTVEKPDPQPVPAAETKSEPAASEDKSAAPAAAAQEAAPAPEQPAAAPANEPTKMADSPTKEPLFQPYLRIDGGYAMTSDPDGTGTNGTHRSSTIQDTGLLGIGIGTRVEDQIRVEGSLTYRSPMSIDGTDGGGNTLSGEVESISAMANLYYDITQAHEWLGNDTFTPYVGGGVGISMLDTDTMQNSAGTSERGTQVYNLTYAAMAGVSSKITDFITADVGYRFINLGQPEQDGSFSGGGSTTATKYDDLFAHEFRAGLRFQF